MTLGQIASNKPCSALPKTVVVLGLKKKKKAQQNFFFPYKILNEKLYNKYIKVNLLKLFYTLSFFFQTNQHNFLLFHFSIIPSNTYKIKSFLNLTFFIPTKPSLNS